MESRHEGLIVVMPAYNEEGCIEKVCRDWLPLVDEASGGRLIVVDDGSRDGTAAVLDRLAGQDPRLLVFHQMNQGHGAALLAAYRAGLALKPRWIFQVDSDAQLSPADFPRLWAQRDSSQFILGDRRPRRDAQHRLVISRVLRLLNRILFGVGIKDCNIPYRLMRADFLRRLLAELPGTPFAPNILLAVLARKSGQDLKEIPVQHFERRTGEVSLARLKLARACLRCLRELAQFRARLGAGAARLRQVHG